MRRRQQDERLRELTAELERERARLAAAEERAQIAAEVHAELAAALGDIVTEAERAEQTALRRTAADALNELRRLHNFDDEDEPGLDGVPQLVERARADGMPVTLLVDGEPRTVPASLSRSVYRVLEEALANVAKHAPGAPATVRLVWRRHLLGLLVRDTGTGLPVELNAGGVGLVAMRERVRLQGGELRAHAMPGGGYEVVARLPL